jgi:arylsulfatase A-like enzyme
MNANPIRIPAMVAVIALSLAGPHPDAAPSSPSPPNVIIISIDTLRADRVSAYGYERSTTPHLDRLIDAGIRFDKARTIEPLTGPALVSMLTAQHPHDHGASRNGLRMRTGLASLPKALQAKGYETAAFVGNWTLRDKLCGLAEHFETYDEVLTRKRWWGLVRREADARDITDGAIEWMRGRSGSSGQAPFMVWAHYVEPHAPYRAHREYFDQLGLTGKLTPSDRYDTEIAFVDASIGRLLEFVDRSGSMDDTLIVFLSDHGESLGEHGYWGHGRHLYEPTLHIPLSITWSGRLSPRTIEAPALIIDVAPTVLGLVGGDQPSAFEGFDWAGVVLGDDPLPMQRLTRYQAHRGAVISKHDSDLARQSGLLEVGIIQNERKEILHVGKNRRELYDLTADPGETRDLETDEQSTSETLLTWMSTVEEGLATGEDTPPAPLDDETVRALRSLGYVD